MAHAFHAYIDESGDEGFKFLKPPERASSEWFVLSAVVVRSRNMPSVARQMQPTLRKIEINGRAAHFSTLPHDARVALVECMSDCAIRTISICVNKRVLQERHSRHTLGRNRRLYFYATRFLLERITWIVRDHRENNSLDQRCKLVFSRCKNLPYPRLAKYLDELQDTSTQIAWEHIDLAATQIEQHDESIFLKAADAVASGTGFALELNRFGGWEDRYVLAIENIMYKRSGKSKSYGLKFFPGVPTIEKDGRYAWIATAFA